MSGSEKVRTLSESSDEPEEPHQGGSDQESLTEVTERSDSDSDSSSSDSSSSDSSSSSSEGEEDGSNLETQTGNISQQTSGVSQESVSNSQQARPEYNHVDLDIARDTNIESWGLDDIQQFLNNSDPASGSGPVDPVFVDHEDSQHATQMDSLVFDSQADDDKSVMDDMNEPRLESVCNSALASADNSVILEGLEGHDLESAQLADVASEDNMEVEDEGLQSLKIRIDKTKMVISPPSRPGHEDGEEKKKTKKRKKERKRKMKTAESDSEVEDNIGRVPTVPRIKKKSKLEPTQSQCHSQTSELQSKSKPIKQDEIINKTIPCSDQNKSAVSGVAKSRRIIPEPSSKPNQTSTVPPPPPPSQTASQEDPRCPLALEVPPPPPGSGEAAAAERKNRKLSIKDYKAKKEAERLRRSLESSGSESVASKDSSPSESKEPSPSPVSLPLVPLVQVKMEEQEDVKQPLAPEQSKSQLPPQASGAVSSDLTGFDVLDEIDEAESMNESESDSLAEDEVDQMLEEDVPVSENPAKDDIQPEEKLTKLVLEERGANVFEVLPLGWVSVTHNSGMPLYLHRETRVVTASKPYDIGNGSVRKHNIPISAIPCYAYRYYSPPQTAPAAQSCPYSSKTSFRENASPDSTTDGTVASQASSSKSPVPSSSSLTVTAAQDTNITNMFPKVQIESIEETMKDTELTPEQLTNYCKKVFVFKELEVAKFKTWKERRAYFKQSQTKKIEKELINRPTLPEGTKIITIPALELSNISGADGDTALNQKVVKKTKKKWIINPVGKSTVCLLHEYVQQSLKTQPYYSFTELDNAATPYAATVRINELEYGRGTGSSKKIAKSEAARRTLEMLIPEIKDKLPSLNGEGDGEGPDLSFFDEIRVEDPRVADLCNRTSEPAPYQILVTCLQRNYGLGDTHIHQDMKTVRNGKNEYRLLVNKREVTVICKNKKDGKQLAAQKLLQQLHPHITSWGSLLRMYGNRSLRKLKIKKDKETEVTGLQTRTSQASVAPSLAILDKLREEMKNLRESKQNIVPIGKFVLPDGLGQTGLNTDHVDL